MRPNLFPMDTNTTSLNKYGFTLESRPGAPMHIDDRHWGVLNKIAMRCSRNVVEVGCYKGRSTSAFIDAINRGAGFHLHLVEPNPTEQLAQVIALCDVPGRVTLYKTKSTSWRLPDVDLWFIDGDHGWPAALDTLNALVSEARIIAMHDTRSVRHGLKHCFGAELVADALIACEKRPFWEDAARRAGEWTHRGLFLSFDSEATKAAHLDCLYPSGNLA
jgi:hypothetical protein